MSSLCLWLFTATAAAAVESKSGNSSVEEIDGEAEDGAAGGGTGSVSEASAITELTNMISEKRDGNWAGARVRKHPTTTHDVELGGRVGTRHFRLKLSLKLSKTQNQVNASVLQPAAVSVCRLSTIEL